MYSAEFYGVTHHTPCPADVCPQRNLPNQISQNMVQMIISDFVPNSAGYLYYNQGLFKGKITNDMIPKWSPINLNTSSWQCMNSFSLIINWSIAIIPMLPQVYPDMLMEADAHFLAPPKMKFKQRTFSIQAPAAIVMNVHEPNGSVTPAFVVQGDLDFTAAVCPFVEQNQN
jgi:hypothetical protein